jgi:hypothetical protein
MMKDQKATEQVHEHDTDKTAQQARKQKSKPAQNKKQCFILVKLGRNQGKHLLQ